MYGLKTTSSFGGLSIGTKTIFQEAIHATIIECLECRFGLGKAQTFEFFPWFVELSMGLPRLTSLLSCIGNSQEWQQACALVAAQSKGHLHPITWQLGMLARRNSALEILQC